MDSTLARPVWSVMIPTFHCAGYLGETLRSVLAQDPGPEAMQIEVVDDHSTEDDPEAVVREIGRGRVSFFRQPANVGTTRNFATCITRSRGRLVHLLHGDDLVRDGFYATLQRAFDADAEIGAAFCRQVFIDGKGDWVGLSPLEQPCSGRLEGALERLATEQRIMTPSIVVRREVYEALGGFDDRLRCSEDWEMWVRIAAHYPVWFEKEPLALYRMHSNSNTGRHVRTAEDMRYTREAIDLFRSHLPPARAADIVRTAKQQYALAAIRTARSLLESRDLDGARAQLAEALRLSRSPRVLASLVASLPSGLAAWSRAGWRP
ncbi:MAG: glycosyltransferase [Gammaproteobacteria bacterium]|nr:glycosyltransferase [Gammaproteobacteria bacterium]